MNIGQVTMADELRAFRIKNAILSSGTYEEIAEKTGINSRTLVRIATGKTEPKFSDIIEISKVTNVSLHRLGFGDISYEKSQAAEIAEGIEGPFDNETNEAHQYVIWNLRTLDPEDIRAIAKQVAALSSYNYTTRANHLEKNKFSLYSRALNEVEPVTLKMLKEMIKNDSGLSEEEVDELLKKEAKKVQEKKINTLLK